MRTSLVVGLLAVLVATAGAQAPPTTQTPSATQPKPAPQPAAPAAPAGQAGAKPTGTTTPAQPAQPARPAGGQATPAAPAQPGQATAKPAPPARASTGVSRAGMALRVADMMGMPLPGVTVDVTGPTPRNGETTDAGIFNLPGLQPGTYRLRFSSKEVATFEKEVAVRAGQILDLDIALTLAPPPPPPAPPPPAPAPVVIKETVPAPVGPLGQPLNVSVLDVLEKEFVGKQPRRESLLSCSGNLRVMMIQLNEPMPERLYENADATYYVLGGEGTLRRGSANVSLATNGYVSVPRGTTHAFTRRGNRPLVLLATLSGEPCEEAK
jgi:hypothetical protein